MNRVKRNHWLQAVRRWASWGAGATVLGLGIVASVERPAGAEDDTRNSTFLQKSTSGGSSQRSVQKSGGSSASSSASASGGGVAGGFAGGSSGGSSNGSSNGSTRSAGGGVAGGVARARASASVDDGSGKSEKSKEAPIRSPGDTASEKLGTPRLSTRHSGKRTITTVDDDARTIVITESPTRITVQVLDHDSEDTKSKSYSAANPEALRMKHPEAFRLYQEHVLNRREQAGAGGASPEGIAAMLKNGFPNLEGLKGIEGLPNLDALKNLEDAEGVKVVEGEEARQLLERQLRELRGQVDSAELRQLIDEQLRNLRP